MLTNFGLSRIFRLTTDLTEKEIYSKEKAQINFTELTLSDQIKLVYVLMNNSFHNV